MKDVFRQLGRRVGAGQPIVRKVFGFDNIIFLICLIVIYQLALSGIKDVINRQMEIINYQQEQIEVITRMLERIPHDQFDRNPI